MFFQNLFDSSQDKVLLEKLIERLVRELPPKLMETKRSALSVNKITRLLETSYKELVGHQKSYKLGFLRRALLANRFKWAMKNKGYPDDFIEVATEGLVVELSKKPTP